MLIGYKLFSSLIKYYSLSYWLRILLHPMLINPQGQPFFSLGLVGFLAQWVTSHDLPLSEFTFYPVTADSALSILLIQLFILVFFLSWGVCQMFCKFCTLSCSLPVIYCSSQVF